MWREGDTDHARLDLTWVLGGEREGEGEREKPDHARLDSGARSLD